MKIIYIVLTPKHPSWIQWRLLPAVMYRPRENGKCQAGQAANASQMSPTGIQDATFWVTNATPLFGRSARSRVNAENKKVNLSWCYSWVWWCGKNDRQSSFRSFFFNRWSISPFLGAETSQILVKPGLFFTCFGNLWYLAHLLSLLVFVPPGLGANNCESMTCCRPESDLKHFVLSKNLWTLAGMCVTTILSLEVPCFFWSAVGPKKIGWWCGVWTTLLSHLLLGQRLKHKWSPIHGHIGLKVETVNSRKCLSWGQWLPLLIGSEVCIQWPFPMEKSSNFHSSGNKKKPGLWTKVQKASWQELWEKADSTWHGKLADCKSLLFMNAPANGIGSSGAGEEHLPALCAREHGDQWGAWWYFSKIAWQRWQTVGKCHHPWRFARNQRKSFCRVA